MTDEELIKAAEKVMGWKVRDGYIGLDLYRPGLPLEHYWPGCDGGGGPGNGWNPLASEGDCWQLVDKLVAKGFGVELEYCTLAKQWGATVVNYQDCSGDEYNPDRRRAIVLACLRACAVDV